MISDKRKNQGAKQKGQLPKGLSISSINGIGLQKASFLPNAKSKFLILFGKELIQSKYHFR